MLSIRAWEFELLTVGEFFGYCAYIDEVNKAGV